MFAAGLGPLRIERYLGTEDDIRGDLNAWAAWLETLEGNAHAGRLMQHVIGTTQLFTLQQPVRASEAGYAARLSRAVCEFLAHTTDGVYQMDGQGIFAADGTPLVHAEEGA